jgi:hypothetical protein
MTSIEKAAFPKLPPKLRRCLEPVKNVSVTGCETIGLEATLLVGPVNDIAIGAPAVRLSCCKSELQNKNTA